MADHAREQVRDQLVTALNTITVANGYTFDANVIVPSRKGSQVVPKDKTLLLYQGFSEISERLFRGATTILSVDQSMFVAVFVSVKATDARDADEVTNEREADVIKAIMTDRTLGGSALDVMFDASLPIEDARENMQGVLLEFVVRFRMNEEDPTQNLS